MTVQVTCPECQASFPLSAGFFDADGKRLAMVLAGAEPALGRAVIRYLALHKPAKQALRLARAAKLAEEVIALATAPEVCRHGTARPNRTAYWVQAIEQMTEARGKLRLPLSGHGYLVEVAAGLADQADAVAERAREEQLRQGRRGEPSGARASALEGAISYAHGMVDLGQWTREQAEAYIDQARAKAGNPV